MQKILLFVLIGGFTVASGFALVNNNVATIESNTLATSAEVTDLSDNLDCDVFDCPISSRKKVVRYFEVDDCKSISPERIRRQIIEIADECCARLRACCRKNGCEEFACEIVEDETFAECVSKTRLCITVVVAFKCQ